MVNKVFIIKALAAIAPAASKPAGGVQLTWKATDVITLNYSNYLGQQGADSVGVRRFYNDLYATMQLSKKLGLIAGLDYGTSMVVP